jgi:hypothetical protein
MSKLSIKYIFIITFYLTLSRAKIRFVFWKDNKPQHSICQADVRYLHATDRHFIPVVQLKPRQRARYFEYPTYVRRLHATDCHSIPVG